MTEQQLSYFLKIAEKQNITQAAQELIVSPPALTATLRRMEKELGCRLFDKCGRNIVLSTYGQILLEHAKVALGALDSAKEQIALAQQHSDMHLTIGLTSPLVCHDALKAFLELHPEIQLTHHVLRINELMSPSLKQEVEYIIASKDDVTGPGWEGQLIRPDNPLVLAVYASHPFANRTSIRLEELSEERFIAIPREYCFRRFLDHVFEKAGLSPNVILECEFALRPTMLKAEYGVLLVTDSVKNTGFSPDTVFIPVTEPQINYPWYIFKNEHSMKSHAASLFWDFMTSYYKNNCK
jgi:DNA-binding transcriptional LysR family regulator